MQAKGQPIARGVDRLYQRLKPPAAPTQHMQHRAKDLVAKCCDIIDLDDRRGHEMSALGQMPRRRHGPTRHLVPARGHLGDMALDGSGSLGGDRRADVCCQTVGRAE